MTAQNSESACGRSDFRLFERFSNATGGYTIDQWEPILNVPVRKVDELWASVKEALDPQYLMNPDLRSFMPDYGLAVLKAGLAPNVEQIILEHHLQLLARVTDELFTVSTTTMIGGIEYLVTLDLSSKLYQKLLASLPGAVARVVSSGLSHAPFQVDLQGKVLLTCSGQLGVVTEGTSEAFVPIEVNDIRHVQFDPGVKLVPYHRGSVVP